MVCDSKFLKWVRDQAALAVLGLVKFNKDVFVGLALMGLIGRALIQMGSSCSIQVLTGLFKIIRTPLVDDINGEIPRIINLLGSKDLSTKVAAMNCILEIAFLGREEVISLMFEEDLIKKLMDAQRLEVCLQSNEDKMKVFVRRREKEPKMEESVEKFPFSRCVASFAVQVEVGEALEQSEKRAFKLEILKRVREAAMVVAEVMWVNKSPVTKRPHCLLVLLALVLPLASAASSTGQQGTPIGSWQPIKNISNPKVKEVAKFVVSEYNKQAQGKSSDPKLVLDSVVRGELQVVHGLKYKLVLSAKNELSVSNPTSTATSDKYEAVVWDLFWQHLKKLISFQPLSEVN
ncbi:PREDICTED: cysteine ase inhibitor [Prunus dulcis]|uniref:PREDICTED: cysteine ase inhibitor n=1 Tax=Prunus dulcis TaxID=3755 RepID=A0A5E4FT93_PRUDU|nr:hypothetical protein L3X38_020890 [Prunus dulcis]VVA30683.1 PREDICTED: cysteine ase inhibitor [Prunus dulcis]